MQQSVQHGGQWGRELSSELAEQDNSPHVAFDHEAPVQQFREACRNAILAAQENR